MIRHLSLAITLIGAAAAAYAAEDARPARPTFDEAGVVHVPAFELPPSQLSSPEAQAFQKMRAKMPTDLPVMDPDINRSRKALATMLAPQLQQVLAAYPVNVEESQVGGVPVRIVTPKAKKADDKRVLINLHGGAFTTCWEPCSTIESAPISAVGGYKVVSVNYRMAPEAKHPAAVEDVAKVYRELLKTYDPKRIGVFGCSAGGALTAQTAAWLPKHNLPQPAAIGIFGAGAVRFGVGDSAYIAAYIDGSFPPPTKEGQRMDLTRGYFDGADMSDPIISPALHLDVLKKFPPTLLITGTRAMDMSPAVYTNSRLLQAGVRSTLIVGEGMGHCYIMSPQLPESRDAYDAIVSFFREHLK
jgi:acetyl esterase/lipase